MNVILVLIDSLNRHYLDCYEPSRVETPNLDRFAGRAWRFDNHFVGSLACIPARREIFAGRQEMVWRPWGPLEPFDQRLPRLLEDGGYSTALVTDHYHYWEQAANGYMQSFQTTQMIRGHEIDFWKQPVDSGEPVPAWVENIEKWRPGKMGRQYYSNVKGFRDETDFFPAKVMTSASGWLEDNAHKQPFFLQVESFDVHEPFHVPEPYASMYTNGDEAIDSFNVWPPYQNPDQLAAFMRSTSDEELDFIRAQYSGKLTMVDRWFGELLDTLDRLQLWDETTVIVTTDHGHDLGERGKFAKQYPHYDSHANIPLLVWHPEYAGNGRSVQNLTQTVDLFPTLLDVGQIEPPEGSAGRSLLPLLDGGDGGREGLLYGSFGQGLCCTDGEWTLFKSPQDNSELYYYSSMIYRSLLLDSANAPADQGYFMPAAELPQWKVPVRVRPLSHENFLFNRRDDPEQSRNLWDTNRRQRQRMLEVLKEMLTLESAPAEQWRRLGLSEGPGA